MNRNDAFSFARSYMKFMVAYRLKYQEEVALHFVILTEYNGKTECCLLPPPSESGWESMDRNDVRNCVVQMVADLKPEYLMMASESWCVMPEGTAEIAAVLRFKRDNPDSSLADYPGAKELLNVILEGNGITRTYVAEIIDGVPAWPPEESDVNEPDKSLRGIYNGLWNAGMVKGMEGVDLN